MTASSGCRSRRLRARHWHQGGTERPRLARLLTLPAVDWVTNRVNGTEIRDAVAHLCSLDPNISHVGLEPTASGGANLVNVSVKAPMIQHMETCVATTFVSAVPDGSPSKTRQFQASLLTKVLDSAVALGGGVDLNWSDGNPLYIRICDADGGAPSVGEISVFIAPFCDDDDDE